MRRISAAGFLVTAMWAGTAQASSWELDPAHSTVGFSVRHMMVSNVRGAFTRFNGTLQLDDKDISKSSVQVDIETTSIDTHEAKRDEHLRSADFFQADKFSKMTFKSDRVEKKGDIYLVSGSLTIRDVTKPVVLSVEGFGPEVKDPWGTTRRGLRGTTTIRRSDYGLTWNKTLETGGVVVGDEVTISIEAELIKKK
jgi:polyisoprenoid-binding protein YceI